MIFTNASIPSFLVKPCVTPRRASNDLAWISFFFLFCIVFLFYVALILAFFIYFFFFNTDAKAATIVFEHSTCSSNGIAVIHRNYRRKSILKSNFDSIYFYVDYSANVRPEFSRITGISLRHRRDLVLLSSPSALSFASSRKARLFPEKKKKEKKNFEVRYKFNVIDNVDSFFITEIVEFEKRFSKNWSNSSITRGTIVIC